MDLPEFWGGLSDTARDTLAEMLRDLSSEASEVKLERIKKELDSLRKEINRTNSRREHLSAKLERVDAVLENVNKVVESGEAGVDLLLFQNVLFGIRSELKREIGVLRPDDRLRKKFEKARRREELIQRAGIAARLYQDVLKEGEPQEVGAEAERE